MNRNHLQVLYAFPGIMNEVAPVTPEEEALYKDIDFDVEDYRKDLGHERLVHHNDKVCFLFLSATCLRFICLY